MYFIKCIYIYILLKLSPLIKNFIIVITIVLIFFISIEPSRWKVDLRKSHTTRQWKSLANEARNVRFRRRERIQIHGARLVMEITMITSRFPSDALTVIARS